MRAYQTSGQRLLPRTPVVVEVMPKAEFSDPFKDGKLMPLVLCSVCGKFGDATFGYTDYAGCSVLLVDYPNWDGFSFRDPQELSSLAASAATDAANHDGVLFTARSFNLPKDEVINYFIWRQMSLASRLLRFNGSKNDNVNAFLNFLETGPISSGTRWPGTWWRGRACNKAATSGDGGRVLFWDLDLHTPVFSEDRGYITSKIYK